MKPVCRACSDSEYPKNSESAPVIECSQITMGLDLVTREDPLRVEINRSVEEVTSVARKFKELYDNMSPMSRADVEAQLAKFRQRLDLVELWAENQMKLGVENGRLLTPAERRLASEAGVANLSAVRIVTVSEIPLPHDPKTLSHLQDAGLLGHDAKRLLLGHVIFVANGTLTTRLLAPALEQIAQVESAGSLRRFISAHWSEIYD